MMIPLRVYFCVTPTLSEPHNQKLTQQVMSDLMLLVRQHGAVQPIILDPAVFMASKLAAVCKPWGSQVKHYTIRDWMPALGIERIFTTEPTAAAAGDCDLALCYYHQGDDADYSLLYDKMLSLDKEWVDRTIYSGSSLRDDASSVYEGSETSSKWFHALQKAQSKIRALPNIGARTKMIVDYRPPRAPGD